MISFKVRFDSNFADARKLVPAAIARGLNEAGDRIRPEVAHALKVQTGVVHMSSITKRMVGSGLGENRAVAGRLAYQILATGKGMPITEFPVANTGRGIDAKTWGVDHLFKRSFEIAGRGPAGFRARLSEKRYPIRKLAGPALPKELVKGEAKATFYASAARHVPEAVLRQLKGALT